LAPPRGAPAAGHGQGKPAAAPAAGWGPPPQKSLAKRLLVGLAVSAFILSLLFNVSMLALLVMASSGSGDLRTTVLQEGNRQQIVALYAIEGPIDGRTSADFRKFFRQISADKDVKAVVLRVNTPGGTVSDSDQVYNLVTRIRKDQGLPIVVSMGGVAASGGYYIAAGADQIYAEPTTITGSIGVIGSWPVVKDLLNEHGVQMVMIRSKQSRGTKATENPFETPSDRTLANMENLLSSMHEKFEQVVRDGRPNLKVTTIEVPIDSPDGDGEKRVVTQTEPLNGQVYLADDAKANGLVDEIGYLDDAVKSAAARARLDKPKVIQYTRPHGLFNLIDAKADASPLDPAKILDDLSTPRIMMMWKMEN